MSGGPIVWITGATSGIGAALAASVPWPDARVVSIARRAHPTLESVRADLADPAGWDALERHLAGALAGFTGERAVFVNNAFLSEPTGFVGEVDPADYRRHLMANAVAPLVLGEMFLRHLPAGVEGGLVMISSAAARVPYAGRAAYGAAKAAMEQWVKAVRIELELRGSPSWVVAIRPGAVDTPAMWRDAVASPDAFPVAADVKRLLEAGQVDSADVAARRIWDVLPPAPESKPVILLGEMIAPPRLD
jgi:NAD(P)-dependent dehydrogenase (short-subunit alcohol dehydrogenase family)